MKANTNVAPCKGIQNPGIVYLWEMFNFACGIQNPGLWNPEYTRRIRNLTLKTGIRNPSSTDKDWNPVPAIWNPQRRIQYPRLCWILLHGARSGIQVGAGLYGETTLTDACVD